MQDARESPYVEVVGLVHDKIVPSGTANPNQPLLLQVPCWFAFELCIVSYGVGGFVEPASQKQLENLRRILEKVQLEGEEIRVF